MNIQYPDGRRPANFNIEIVFWTKFGTSENAKCLMRFLVNSY